jgi:predicted nucleic acid-binding protein
MQKFVTCDKRFDQDAKFVTCDKYFDLDAKFVTCDKNICKMIQAAKVGGERALA